MSMPSITPLFVFISPVSDPLLMELGLASLRIPDADPLVPDCVVYYAVSFQIILERSWQYPQVEAYRTLITYLRGIDA